MKQILFVSSRAPHGSINGQEALDALLAGSAFTRCELLLLDDGIFQIVANQATGDLGVKDYSVSFGALADYGVETIYVAETHLAERGLSIGDLALPVAALSDEQVSSVMSRADVILSF